MYDVASSPEEDWKINVPVATKMLSSIFIPMLSAMLELKYQAVDLAFIMFEPKTTKRVLARGSEDPVFVDAYSDAIGLYNAAAERRQARIKERAPGKT